MTTNVSVTQYNAEFRAEPFSRPRWTIRGGMQYREVLSRRRRWTVVRDIERSHDRVAEIARRIPNTGIGHIHESVLIDRDAQIVFVPDNPGSRYGTALVVEEVAR